MTRYIDVLPMRNCDLISIAVLNSQRVITSLICQAQDPPCVQHSSPLTAPQRPQPIARPHAHPHVRLHALPIAHQYLRLTRVGGPKAIWDMHTNHTKPIAKVVTIAIFWTSCSWLAFFHPRCAQSCVQPPVLQRQRLSFQSNDAPSDASQCGIHLLVSKSQKSIGTQSVSEGSEMHLIPTSPNIQRFPVISQVFLVLPDLSNFNPSPQNLSNRLRQNPGTLHQSWK